jgi:hypothetical protein
METDGDNLISLAERRRKTVFTIKESKNRIF